MALYQLSYSPLKGWILPSLSHPVRTIRVVPAETPTEVGARAEAAVASALTRAGRPVFLPAFGVNSRIDLIYVEHGDLVRAQCKAARVVGEVLVFRTL